MRLVRSYAIIIWMLLAILIGCGANAQQYPQTIPSCTFAAGTAQLSIDGSTTRLCGAKYQGSVASVIDATDEALDCADVPNASGGGTKSVLVQWDTSLGGGGEWKCVSSGLVSTSKHTIAIDGTPQTPRATLDFRGFDSGGDDAGNDATFVEDKPCRWVQWEYNIDDYPRETPTTSLAAPIVLGRQMMVKSGDALGEWSNGGADLAEWRWISSSGESSSTWQVYSSVSGWVLTSEFSFQYSFGTSSTSPVGEPGVFPHTRRVIQPNANLRHHLGNSALVQINSGDYFASMMESLQGTTWRSSIGATFYAVEVGCR